MYRQWTVDLDKCLETWLVHIKVGESVVQSMNTKHLWYGSDWNDIPLMMVCPANADGVERHVCRLHLAKVAMIKKEHIQERRNEGYCLILPDGMKERDAKKISVACSMEPLSSIRKKVLVRVYPPMLI